MKELTIEQKAQRYDEAIEIAKRINNEQQAQPFNIMTRVFPELKESEGERIRKALINFLHEGNPFKNIKKETRQRWIAWLEKQGEQKPADKVKPKFKVGDWIINTITKEVEQVIELTGCEYICSGHLIVSFNNQHLLKRWDIEDAKDGDVLYLQKDGKEHIIIYKGVIKERFRTFVSAYCAYNGIVDAFCFADVSRYVDITYRGIMPATKEQRDQLEKAITEAGYEWDVEKKELKKIEQTSTDEIGNYDHKEVIQTIINEQNLAWSEEDENIKESIITGLEMLKDGASDESLIALYNKKIDWLKSLRPQSQWKPSDEQIYALRSIVTELKRSDNKYQETIEDLYQDLKKLIEE